MAEKTNAMRFLEAHRSRSYRGHGTLVIARLAVGAAMAVATGLLWPIDRAPLDDGTAQGQGARLHVYLPLLSPEVRQASAVRFSVGRGLYDESLTVELATDTPGAAIRFTTDGSRPVGGEAEIYRRPLRLHRTTVVRAVAFRHGYLPSPVATNTYVILEATTSQPAWPPGLPTNWGRHTDGPDEGEPVAADYGMDPEVIADPRYGPMMRAALLSLPSLSIATDPAGLFGEKDGIYVHARETGVDWERNASVELFDARGAEGFQIDCGVRISGQASRNPYASPKKSFSLRFTSRHGPTKLEYPLFPSTPVSEFDTLKLRAGFNDSFAYVPWRGQYLRDAWGTATQAATGSLAVHGRFVHLYLNGLYWGLYRLSEEPTASFMARHLGGRRTDYDVVKSAKYGAVEDGDRREYDELLRIPRLWEPTGYEKVARLLDLSQHAEYVLLNVYAANTDWPGTGNWRAGKKRSADKGFVYFAWDMEAGLDLLQPDHGAYDERVHDKAATIGVDGLHGRLRRSPEYRLLFADRARELLFDGGVLTGQRARERYAALAEELDPAIIAESARWGDADPGALAMVHGWDLWRRFWAANGQGHPVTRDDEWLAERDRLLEGWFEGRTQTVIEQLCREGLLTDVVAPDLQVRSWNGTRGSVVEMRPGSAGCAGARTSGTIYYTTDGSDPREPWTGIVGSSAESYEAPVVVLGFAQVRARMRSGTDWSAVTTVTLGEPQPVLSELMYNPPEGSDHEFLEIANNECAPVHLGGMSLEGVRYTFPPDAVLAPGARAVVASDSGALGDICAKADCIGEFDGHLSDGGERVALRNARGEVVFSVEYDDEGLWPLSPDGGGYSLVRDRYDRDPDNPEAWRASAQPGGSPGAPDPQSPASRIVVNELLPNAGPPYEPAIELCNTSDQPVRIGGWFLSDDRDDLRKVRISDDIVLDPHGYQVLYGPDLEGTQAFALDPLGGSLFLSSSDGPGGTPGVIRGITYPAAEANVSVGRYHVRGRTRIVALSEPTFGVTSPASIGEFRQGLGEANAQPLVGPVVMNEIHYHPTAGESEFIELRNTGPMTVTLRPEDGEAFGMALTAGVRFVFPPGATLAPQSYALITGDEPRTFRLRHNLGDDVQVHGPFHGQLADDGECVVVSRAVVSSDGERIAQLVADEVCYANAAEWPTAADGGGPSLERTSGARFGDDPTNWSAFAVGGTPGVENTAVHVIQLPIAAIGSYVSPTGAD